MTRIAIGMRPVTVLRLQRSLNRVTPVSFKSGCQIRSKLIHMTESLRTSRLLPK
jgi:hypothetical protein